MNERWMMFEGEDEAHYLSPDDVLEANEAFGGEAREWSVFQDVGRVALCELCKDWIRETSKASKK
jgi:hypothetical protein